MSLIIRGTYTDPDTGGIIPHRELELRENTDNKTFETVTITTTDYCGRYFFTVTPSEPCTYCYWLYDSRFVPIEVYNGTYLRSLTVKTFPYAPLSITLSGEFDYLRREPVKIRLSALVEDADTVEPVSDANVTLDIYKPNGEVLTSGVMIEQIPQSGVYEWQSSETIKKLGLEKGVYLVHVKASHLGATTSGILEFHIDPPGEEPVQLHWILLFILATALATTISVWYADHRRLTRKLSEPQRTMY